MYRIGRIVHALALYAALALVSFPEQLDAQELPRYLRDRGPGVATSMFGTYMAKG